jgi:hypothetical protein
MATGMGGMGGIPKDGPLPTSRFSIFVSGLMSPRMAMALFCLIPIAGRPQADLTIARYPFYTDLLDRPRPFKMEPWVQSPFLQGPAPAKEKPFLIGLDIDQTRKEEEGA